ncbi:MAG: hypothetical protein KAR40_11325 [Candidatus Sabulitectum sp.]|nr:hypothetical protein [Candidatus Sabulitectum sp.]
MSGEMDAQEIAEANQEWNKPLEMQDWLTTKQAKETLMDSYFDTSEALQKELKDVPLESVCKPFTEIERRARLERQAYLQIDCAVADAYAEYLEMHPSKIGHLTETFSRIYGEDGL